MINIISRALVFKGVSGPAKVVRNLIKGLELTGYPYTVNNQLLACKRLYIHDDRKALEKAMSLGSEVKIVAGPNIYLFPRDIPKSLDLSNVIYLNPSSWGKDFWECFGYKNRGPLEVWPTGIDTYEFLSFQNKKEYVLVYFKQRFQKELEFVIETLNRKRIDYEVIIYDNGYSEGDYKQLLSKSRYIVWIGRQESQGIALQEAMSCNVPILVFDVPYVGYCKGGEDMTEEEKAFKNTTSAPSFDETCGLKIKALSELQGAIDYMEAHVNTFRPRDYIVSNLSLEKKARDFVFFYEKYFGLTFEQGLREGVLRQGVWINRRFYYATYLRLKHFIKIFLVRMRIWNYIYLLKRRLRSE